MSPLAAAIPEHGLPTLLRSRPRMSPDTAKPCRPVPPALKLCDALPPAICVKNTFIEVQSPPPSALHQRQALRTCPSRHVGRLLMPDCLSDVCAEPLALPSPCQIETPFGQTCFEQQLAAVANATAFDGGLGYTATWKPVLSLTQALGELAAAAGPPPPPPGPAPGTAELPSVGSVGHFDGSCRPCAFVHAGRCQHGPACSFCHLCGPEERKRRRKDKLEARRAAKELERSGDLVIPRKWWQGASVSPVM